MKNKPKFDINEKSILVQKPQDVQTIAYKIAESLAFLKDKILMETLDERYGKGKWKLEDAMKKITIHPNDEGGELICLGDTTLLKFYNPELSFEHAEGRSTVSGHVLYRRGTFDGDM